MNLKVILPALLLLFCLNCASGSAGIATSSEPLKPGEYTVLGPAETSVSWWSIDIGFFALPLSVPPVDEARDALLSEKGGNALVNIRYSTDRSIFLFMTRHRFHLKADVVRKR